MALITVDPVVVKPDIVSKKASVKVKKTPSNKYGNPPKNENTTHVKVTIKKLSLVVKSSVFFVSSTIAKAAIKVIITV